jgi:hypothetical protein
MSLSRLRPRLWRNDNLDALPLRGPSSCPLLPAQRSLGEFTFSRYTTGASALAAQEGESLSCIAAAPVALLR